MFSTGDIYDNEEGGGAGHSLPTPEDLKTEQVISSIGKEDREDFQVPDYASKTRRLRPLLLWIAGALCLVLIIGLSVGLATRGEREGKATGQELEEGRPSSVDADLWAQIVALLEPYTLRRTLVTSGTPQHEAASWLAEQVVDYQLPVPETSDYETAVDFLQPYALATLYFALDGPNWKYKLGFLNLQQNSVCRWREKKDLVPTNPFMISAQEGIIPKAIRTIRGDSLADHPDIMSTNVGVKCNEDGEVVLVFLPDNNLKGELPSELGILRALKHFSVDMNAISGTLPSTLAQWTNMEVLNVEDNQLKGPIPPFVRNWVHLKALSLAKNHFTGSVPNMAALTKLRTASLNDNQLTGGIAMFNQNLNLETLFLQNNKFTGVFDQDLLDDVNLYIFDCSNNSITGQLNTDWYSVDILNVHTNQLNGVLPETDGSHHSLAYLSAYGNNLEGQLPDNLNSLTTLYHLDVSDNLLTGTIPTTLDGMDRLEYLYLGDNDYDEQPFPPLGDCLGLQELSLRSCNIRDTIPPFVGRRLNQLVLLDLSDNSLQGEIPHHLARPIGMRFLLLSHNNFTGTVPENLAALPDLNLLTVDHNPLLYGSLGDICSDEWGPANLDILRTDCTLNCTCCDECCALDADDDKCGNDEVSPNLLGQGHYKRGEFVFTEELVFAGDEDGDD